MYLNDLSDLDVVSLTKKIAKNIIEISDSKNINELPVIATVADFRDVVVSKELVDYVLALKETFMPGNEDLQAIDEVIKYKGGYLTFVIIDEDLDEIKSKANNTPESLKYQFLLAAFSILSNTKAGGGIAKNLDTGTQNVIDLIKNHPLYKLRMRKTEK